VTVSVDAVVYYRVSNATVSIANVENAHHSTRLLAQTTLRNILGTRLLHEILSDRENIQASMQVTIWKPYSECFFLTCALSTKKSAPSSGNTKYYCLNI
jgi:SPFH domain / Band 7 family